MDGSLSSFVVGATYLASIILFALMVIMKRRPVGVSLAWLVLLFALPFAGFICYLLFGSRRLGSKRLKRIAKLYPDYEQWSEHLSRVIYDSEPESHPVVSHSGIYRLAEHTMAIPALPGNKLELYHQSDDIIAGLLADIEGARKSLVLEFYIWEPVGRIRELAMAVIAAAKRGVHCLIILDAVGSRSFLKSPWRKRFNEAGIRVTESMPVGLLRMLVERIDIRNHRKVMVVDDAVAWTGSFNLVDPEFFRQGAQIGQWVDAMVRIEGVAAHVLGVVVQWDQALETGEGLPSFNRTYELPVSLHTKDKMADVHVLPSGPGLDREVLHQVLLAAIYESQEELLMSTPYFIPDESLLTALKSAAMRGVCVKLLVPEKNDSRMVHHASRAYYEELLACGVEIHQFRGGLLHTKCALVDRVTALFGTVNLDMRSVWLNFELTLVVYDEVFGQTIAALMDSYLAKAEPVVGHQWKKRPFHRKLLENTMQLLSPLL
ncbi:cardiolipin synthase [Endozoicomonas sp. Mp262]|uniref:cardiolipin synthase n=1 Tax=Endozoicomonas sp. Mp262 TaxID=2919499 RepID=UPI0021DB7F39